VSRRTPDVESAVQRGDADPNDTGDLILGGALGEHLAGLALLRRGEHRLTAADPAAAAAAGGVEPGPGAFPDQVALDYVDTRVLSRRFDRSISRVAGYRAFRGCPAEPAAS